MIHLRGVTPPVALRKMRYFLPTLAAASGFLVISSLRSDVEVTSLVVRQPQRVGERSAVTVYVPAIVGLP